MCKNEMCNILLITPNKQNESTWGQIDPIGSRR